MFSIVLGDVLVIEEEMEVETRKRRWSISLIQGPQDLPNRIRVRE